MPRATKGLAFDSGGTCALCAEYRRRPPSASKEATTGLEQTIEATKRRGAKAPFDCVVGVSGGMDSTYLLHLLTRTHRLRCLAAYYRTPFTPPEIDANVRRITSRLSVPLVQMDISNAYHLEVASYFVRAWRERPDQILVNLACAPCKLLNRELFHVAERQGIPTVVHGIHRHEAVTIAAGQLRSRALNPYALTTGLLQLSVIAGRGLAALRRSSVMLRHLGLVFKASALYLSPYTVFLRFRHPRVHVVNYFDEAEWNEQDIRRVLDDLGWKLPDGYRSPKKADCSFAHLKNAMTSLSSGANYSDAIFSNMVREGVLGRDEALNRLEQEGQPALTAVRAACRTLGLPEGYLGLPGYPV